MSPLPDSLTPFRRQPRPLFFALKLIYVNNNEVRFVKKFRRQNRIIADPFSNSLFFHGSSLLLQVPALFAKLSVNSVRL
jgi:hypothetical protein